MHAVRRGTMWLFGVSRLSSLERLLERVRFDAVT